MRIRIDMKHKRSHKPTRRAGGSLHIGAKDDLANALICFGVRQSSLGWLLVASGDNGVVSILIGKDSLNLIGDLKVRLPHAHLLHSDQKCARLLDQVMDFVEAPSHDLDFSLDVRGTGLQIQIWQALRAIPIGQTRTYEDIALDVGLSHDVEAVCDACAANQIALAIPCHRALGAMNTSPAGYRWGRTRQRELIDREVAVSAGIYAPGSASLIMPHLRVKRWSELDKEFEARVRDLFLK